MKSSFSEFREKVERGCQNTSKRTFEILRSGPKPPFPTNLQFGYNRIQALAFVVN